MGNSAFFLPKQSPLIYPSTQAEKIKSKERPPLTSEFNIVLDAKGNYTTASYLHYYKNTLDESQLSEEDGFFTTPSLSSSTTTTSATNSLNNDVVPFTNKHYFMKKLPHKNSLISKEMSLSSTSTLSMSRSHDELSIVDLETGSFDFIEDFESKKPEGREVSVNSSSSSSLSTLTQSTHILETQSFDLSFEEREKEQILHNTSFNNSPYNNSISLNNSGSFIISVPSRITSTNSISTASISTLSPPSSTPSSYSNLNSLTISPPNLSSSSYDYALQGASRQKHLQKRVKNREKEREIYNAASNYYSGGSNNHSSNIMYYRTKN